MHLDQEHIERLLHGELTPAASQGVREHLAGCDRCRERLDSAKRDEAEIFALFRQVDHPPPTVSAEAVADRARSAGLVWGRWAAGILMVVGLAGAAYAAPGSPLRDWARSVAAWIGVAEPSRQEPTLVQPPAARAAGVAAVPGPNFVIDFEAADPGGEAQVTLTTGTEVTVRAPTGAASFTSAAGRLVIDNSSSGATYEIEIPRTAPRVEIRVAGKRLFLKDGPRVVGQSPSEAQSPYIIPLAPLP